MVIRHAAVLIDSQKARGDPGESISAETVVDSTARAVAKLLSLESNTTVALVLNMLSLAFSVSNTTGGQPIFEFCVAHGPRCGQVDGFELSLCTLTSTVLNTQKKLS